MGGGGGGPGRGHAGPASGIPGHLLPGAWGLDEPLGRPRAPGRPSTHRKGNGSGKPKRGDEATNGKPETGNRPPPCQPKAPIVNELWPILTGVDAGGITGGRRRLSAATPAVFPGPRSLHAGRGAGVEVAFGVGGCCCRARANAGGARRWHPFRMHSVGGRSPVVSPAGRAQPPATVLDPSGIGSAQSECTPFAGNATGDGRRVTADW